MDLRNLPDEEISIVVTKVVTKFGSRMDEHSENLRYENSDKGPNRSHQAKKYNMWTEKLNSLWS